MRSMLKRVVGMAAVAGSFAIAVVGCTRDETTEKLNQAEQAAETAGKAVSDSVSELAKQGEALAGKLGAEAANLLKPMKDQFGSLEQLKQSPEQLKVAVNQMIQAIETQVSKLQLPDRVKQGLTAVQAKLVSLRDYLAGEYEQAKIDEHIRGILETAKSQLGID